jgi:hypothetical protein
MRKFALAAFAAMLVLLALFANVNATYATMTASEEAILTAATDAVQTTAITAATTAKQTAQTANKTTDAQGIDSGQSNLLNTTASESKQFPLSAANKEQVIRIIAQLHG